MTPPVEMTNLFQASLLLESKIPSSKQICHLACPGVPWDRSVA
jgi:hypothetical protein